MLVGILSDSHDHANTVRRAFSLLEACGAEAFFHCGDVGGQDVLDLFVGRRIWFVWGNTDWASSGTRAFLETVGLPIPTVPVRAELAGKTIAMCHGHEPEFHRLTAMPETDYLFHGHTHNRSDARVRGCRIINPGDLARTPPRTVATLDLDSDELIFHEID